MWKHMTLGFTNGIVNAKIFAGFFKLSTLCFSIGNYVKSHLESVLHYGTESKGTYQYQGTNGWVIEWTQGGSPFDLKIFAGSLPGASSLMRFVIYRWIPSGGLKVVCYHITHVIAEWTRWHHELGRQDSDHLKYSWNVQTKQQVILNKQLSMSVCIIITSMLNIYFVMPSIKIINWNFD